MQELISRVLYGFDVKARSISKHKLIYICNTNEGTKSIKQIPLDRESAKNNIIFQHNVKENLASEGFVFLDRFDMSIKNEPFYVLDGKTFVMTDYLPYRESSFSNHDEFEQIIKTVAKMHLLFKKTPILPLTTRIPKPYDINKQYEKDLYKLNAFKKLIYKHKQLSDFDVIFCNNYDYYVSCLNKWFEVAEEIDYKKTLDDAVKNGYICHNLLKEEYILINKNDVYITNFKDCCYGHYIIDLVSIIKRHFKVNLENSLCITDIISLYSIENPLTDKEIKILYAMLIYPDKFIKINSQYYTKKRSWTPGSFNSRIESVIQTKDLYAEYIDNICSLFAN